MCDVISRPTFHKSGRTETSAMLNYVMLGSESECERDSETRSGSAARRSVTADRGASVGSDNLVNMATFWDRELNKQVA